MVLYTTVYLLLSSVVSFCAAAPLGSTTLPLRLTENVNKRDVTKEILPAGSLASRYDSDKEISQRAPADDDTLSSKPYIGRYDEDEKISRRTPADDDTVSPDAYIGNYDDEKISKRTPEDDTVSSVVFVGRYDEDEKLSRRAEEDDEPNGSPAQGYIGRYDADFDDENKAKKE